MKLDSISDEILDIFEGICYVTDLDGTIIHIGPSEWESFASENEAQRLTYAETIGKTIFSFIKGQDVQDNLRKIFDTLKSGSYSKWILPYRCDSPNEKRNMRLAVSVVTDNGKVSGYIFQSILLEAETRPPIDLFDFREVSALLKEVSNRPFLSMCSYCQKVKDDTHTHGKWLEAEDYYHAGGDAKVAISHTLCESCVETSKQHLLK